MRTTKRSTTRTQRGRRRLRTVRSRGRHVAARRRRPSSAYWEAPSPNEPPAAQAPPLEEQYAGACRDARTHLIEGRADEAVAAARTALEVFPRGLTAQRLLGLSLLENGEARPASNAFSAALRADPLDVVSQVGLAESVERLSDAGAARAEWLRAWELDPGAIAIAERLRQASLAAGVLDVREGPPPLTRAALARTQLRSGLYEHAASEARAVLAREPDRLDIQLALAEAHWRSGDAGTAAAIASTIVDRVPDCVAANLLLAAHWGGDGREVAPLIARIAAVDPEGTVAARLFDDREVPALFGDDTGLDSWRAQAPALAPSPDAVVAAAEAETAVYPVFAGEPPRPPTEMGPAVKPEAAIDEFATAVPEAPEVSAAPETEVIAAETGVDAAPFEAESIEAVHVEAAPEVQPPAHVAGPLTLEPLPAEEPPDHAAWAAEETQPVAALDVAERPAAPEAGPPGDVAGGEEARALGDAAMRDRRYADAMRHYGAWLRHVRGRTAGSDTGLPGPEEARREGEFDRNG